MMGGGLEGWGELRAVGGDDGLARYTVAGFYPDADWIARHCPVVEEEGGEIDERVPLVIVYRNRF